ncbi:MAG: hypothetical protein J0M11_14180 [Anaerolineae bacterium]|jgi:hypothetical protein|nr:hypothetical protein [Anaerolineae bacterium]
MHKYSVILVSLFLLSCLSQPTVLEPQTTVTSVQTQTKTLAPTLTKQPIPSPTPPLIPNPDIIISPDGNYYAQVINNISEKPKIEIRDKSEKVLWEIPYQYTWEGSSAPTSNLKIYGWSLNSDKVYFYYSFSYDGWYTLFDGSDLQSINVQTGKVEKIIADCCFAFDFSSNMTHVAYTLNYEVGILDLINGTNKKTNILPGNYEQTGWIHYSPSGDMIIFHTLDETGMVKSILLNVHDMSQKIILEFVIESIFSAGWSETENPRYWQVDNNSVFEVDKQTLEQVLIGTATPYP